MDNQTIGERVNEAIEQILILNNPRNRVLEWMERNPFWYREIIAQEWQRQTGDDWEELFGLSVRQSPQLAIGCRK